MIKNKLAPILLMLSSLPVSALAQSTLSGWSFELEPFYAKATDDLLTESLYAVKVADPAIQGDHRELYHRAFENDWGGRLAVGYTLPSCSNSNYGFSLAYTFFDNQDNRHIHNDNRNSAGRPVLAPAEFIDITEEGNARFSDVKSNLATNYSTIDLLAEKNIAFCQGSKLKFFGGFRYFHLNEDLHNHYEFVGDIETVRVTNVYDVRFENHLDTIGPEIGARGFYHLGSCFGLVGQLSGALLYGQANSEFNNEYHLAPTSALGDTTNLTSSTHLDDSAHFVPALSGKVAISYQGSFELCRSFTLEAGYRGDKYFNAANDTAYQQLLAGDDINSKCNYQNFSIAGPFLSLTVRV